TICRIAKSIPADSQFDRPTIRGNCKQRSAPKKDRLFEDVGRGPIRCKVLGKQQNLVPSDKPFGRDLDGFDSRRYFRTQRKSVRVHRQSDFSAKAIAGSLSLCVEYKIRNRVWRWFIGKEQSQRSAFNDSLRCRLIVNLGSDMRSRREPERG